MILQLHFTIFKIFIITQLSTITCPVEATKFDLVKGNYAQFDIVSKIQIFRLTDSIGDLKQQKFLKLFTTLDNQEKLFIKKLYENGGEELFEITVENQSSKTHEHDEKIVLSRKAGNFQFYTTNQNWSFGKAFVSALDFDMQDDRLSITRENKADTLKRYVSTESIGYQESLIKALKYGSKLNQTITYKLDGKLLEEMIIKEEMNLNVYAQKFLRLNIRIEIKPSKANDFDEKDQWNCNNVEFTKCLSEAIERNKLKSGAYNTGDFYAKMLTLEPVQSFDESKKCFLSDYLKSVNKYGQKQSVHALFRTMRRAKMANLDSMKSCLKIKGNETNMHAILSIFALTGRADIYHVIKDEMMLDVDQFLNWRLFVSVLPFSLNPNVSILSDLMTIVQYGEDLDDVLTLSTATLLNKLLMKNRENVEKHVETFVEKFLSCTTEKCTRVYLRSFENLRHEKLLKPVLNKLCTNNFQHDEQALKFLQKMPAKSWMSDEVFHKMKLLLKNRCPKPVDQTARMMAGNFLLTLAHPSNVSELIFDIFDSLEGCQKSSNEIRSYILNLVQQLAEERPYFKDILGKLRKQNFYNEWNQFFGGGLTKCATRAVDFFGFFEPFYNMDMEFNRNILKRFSTNVGLKIDESPSTLFGIELYSKAILPALELFGSKSDDSDRKNHIPTSNDLDISDQAETEAGLLLTLFDHNLAPIRFFEGQAALMSAAWNADGAKMLAFNNSMVLNEFRLSLPAMTGHVIDLTLTGAFSLRLGGNVEISIWYRTLKASLWSRGSFGMSSQVQIRQGDSSHVKDFFNHEVEILTEFGSTVNTDVDFYASPVRFCVKIEGEPTKMEMKMDEKHLNQTEKATKKLKREFEGVSANIPQLSRACTLMYEG